jgi:predicted DNA-binding transcriptional regulator AlpA
MQTETPQLLTMRDVCALFGGSRPIDPATLYRGIRAGRYPAPIKIGLAPRDGCGPNVKQPFKQ